MVILFCFRCTSEVLEAGDISQWAETGIPVSDELSTEDDDWSSHSSEWLDSHKNCVQQLWSPSSKSHKTLSDCCVLWGVEHTLGWNSRLSWCEGLASTCTGLAFLPKDRLLERHLCLNLYPCVLKVQSVSQSFFSLVWPATLILFLAMRTHRITVLVNIFIKYLPQESWWRHSITKCCHQMLWNALFLWIIAKIMVTQITNLSWVCQRVVSLNFNAIKMPNLCSIVFTLFGSFTSVIVFFCLITTYSTEFIHIVRVAF